MALRPLRLFSALFLLAGVILAGCAEAPVTGRDQLILLSPEQAQEMGAAAFQEIKSETPISRNQALTEEVRSVGRRIVAASNEPGFDWEFVVFEDERPNAFALPGGKVGVNSGLFKVVENRDQLAAVMGHEIGHAIAQHSAERVSNQILVQTGLGLAGASGLGEYSDLMAQAATLGVVLPFSRSQEAEADEIGLTYMARAGYDPRAAVEVWQNFRDYGGERPPEFLSTHPSPDTRIERLQALIPSVMPIYEAARRS